MNDINIIVCFGSVAPGPDKNDTFFIWLCSF